MPRPAATARRSGRMTGPSSTSISARTSTPIWRPSSRPSGARSAEEESMQLGFIGLGRMGANMVRRLVRDGHSVVAYNRTVEKAVELAEAEHGAGHDLVAASSVGELVSKLATPRVAW